MTENAQPIDRIEDIPPELRPLFIEAVKAARYVQDEEIKRLYRKQADAEQRGYDRAIGYLRDINLYMQWRESLSRMPEGAWREIHAAYLTDVAPGGRFWEATR